MIIVYATELLKSNMSIRISFDKKSIFMKYNEYKPPLKKSGLKIVNNWCFKLKSNFIIQRVKAPCPHQPPTRGDIIVSVAKVVLGAITSFCHRTGYEDK